MIHELTAIEQEEILRELRQVFDETTTEVLGRVLGRMTAQMEQMRAPHEQPPDLQGALAKLAEAQARTEVEVRQLAEAQRYMAQDMAAFKGRQLELTYLQRAGAYFGPFLRRVRALLPVELEDDLEAHLSPEEFRDLLLLDLLVRGRPRYHEDAPEVWLAVEISAVIDRHDVERALRRASYLRRAGYRAIPTVTGERATEGADQEAEARRVLMLLDSRVISWEEALDEVLS